jgi:hypothetical protein
MKLDSNTNKNMDKVLMLNKQNNGIQQLIIKRYNFTYWL